MPNSTVFDFNPDAIGHVLTDRRLAVPIYQRSYSWDEGQITDYWSDLSGALADGNSQYFLGNIVLSEEGTEGSYTIIDGQQRLATTLILLAAVRNEYRRRGDDRRAQIIQGQYVAVADLSTSEDRPRLQMNSDDDPYFHAVIINGENPESVPALHSSHTLIRKALEYFEKQIGRVAEVASTGWEDRIHSWVQFLAADARIIVVDVPTEADAFLIFETLNDRGADLTIADLLKNYLFGRAGSRLDTVRDAWITSLGALEMSAEDSLFTIFLRHLWSSKYGATRERELYKSIKDNIASQAQTVAFSQELKSSARNYAAILSSDHEFWSGTGTATKTNLETLTRLNLEQMRPLLLAAMQHFTNEELKRTLKALVSWGVRGLVVGGIGGGKTERAYCQAAVKIRSGEIKVANELVTALSEIIPTDEEFKANFAKVRVTKNKLARYYLSALERTENAQPEPELVPNQDEEQVNLEHILPQSPAAGDWDQFTVDEQRAWVYRLGNMALLSKGPNGRIGNRPWSDKKPVLGTSALSLTNQAAQEDDWTTEVIDKRQQSLAALAVRTWPRNP